MVSKKDKFSLKKLLTGADGDYDYQHQLIIFSN